MGEKVDRSAVVLEKGRISSGLEERERVYNGLSLFVFGLASTFEFADSRDPLLRREPVSSLSLPVVSHKSRYSRFLSTPTEYHHCTANYKDIGRKKKTTTFKSTISIPISPDDRGKGSEAQVSGRKVLETHNNTTSGGL